MGVECYTVDEDEFEANPSRHTGPEGVQHRHNWPKLCSCNDLNVIVLSTLPIRQARRTLPISRGKVQLATFPRLNLTSRQSDPGELAEFDAKSKKLRQPLVEAIGAPASKIRSD